MPPGVGDRDCLLPQGDVVLQTMRIVGHICTFPVVIRGERAVLSAAGALAQCPCRRCNSMVMRRAEKQAAARYHVGSE